MPSGPGWSMQETQGTVTSSAIWKTWPTPSEFALGLPHGEDCGLWKIWLYVSWWIITGAVARTLSLSQAPVCPVWSSWASNGHQSIFNGSSPSVVCILPQEGKDTALFELYDVVSYQANHGDTALIVGRDLPNCCYKRVQPTMPGPLLRRV